MEQITDLLFGLLSIPFEVLDRAQSEPSFLIAALVAVALVVIGIARYQRCPHCRRVVRRSRSEWRRCPGCGRQYHWGVPWMR